MKAAPAKALATLTCNRASVCVYVIRQKDRTFPYALHIWDRELNDGAGGYVHDNAFVTLIDAVREATSIFATKVRQQDHET